MNPYFRGTFELMGQIRNSLLASIRAYFSGDSSINVVGALTTHINKEAASTTNVIKSGVNDLVDASYIDGSVRVVSATSPTKWIVAPNVKVIQISWVEDPGAVTLLGIGGNAVNPGRTSTTQLTYGTATIDKQHVTVDINSSFDTSTDFEFTSGTIYESALVFIQPSTLQASGVAVI